MNLSHILSKASGIVGGMSNMFGDGDKKPKKPFDWNAELKAGYKGKLKYDNNTPANEIILQAAKEGKIDPAELMTSAWVEGLNKAVANPDTVSEAYNKAAAKDATFNQFPVDAFHNYGVDTFGNNYERLKKYLPADYAEGKNFKYFDALNEKNQPIKTIATKTNKDALVAKAAFMNMAKDDIADYAQKKGLNLDDKQKRYFMLAYFNGGPGRATQMIDEYAGSKDRGGYFDKGLTSLGQIHKNISPRMKMYELAKQLLYQNEQPLPSPQKIVTQ